MNILFSSIPIININYVNYFNAIVESQFIFRRFRGCLKSMPINNYYNNGDDDYDNNNIDHNNQ